MQCMTPSLACTPSRRVVAWAEDVIFFRSLAHGLGVFNLSPLQSNIPRVAPRVNVPSQVQWRWRWLPDANRLFSFGHQSTWWVRSNLYARFHATSDSEKHYLIFFLSEAFRYSTAKKYYKGTQPYLLWAFSRKKKKSLKKKNWAISIPVKDKK